MLWAVCRLPYQCKNCNCLRSKSQGRGGGGREGAVEAVVGVISAKNTFKGTISPQVYACVDEMHFEIVGLTLSNTIGEFRKLFFICLNRFHLRKVR